MDSTAFSQGLRIPEAQVALMLPQIPALLTLLRSKPEHRQLAGDALAKSYTHKITSSEIMTGYALSELLKLLATENKVNSLNASFDSKAAVLENYLPHSNKDLVKLFLCFEPSVWFRVILVILTTAPKEDVLEKRLREKLLCIFMRKELVRKQAKKDHQSFDVKQNIKALVHELKACLSDTSSGKPSEVFIEVLRFLRSGTKNWESTCEVLGPLFLIPYEFGEQNAIYASKSMIIRKSCATLLKLLGKNCHDLFGKDKVSAEDLDDPTYSLSIMEVDEVRIRRLKYHLQNFFEIRDPNCANSVECLFEYYEFTDIARCIFIKYKMLPLGWKPELESTLKGNVANFFGQFLPGSPDLTLRHQKASNAEISREHLKDPKVLLVPGKPFEWFEKFHETKRIRYLNEKNMAFPEITKASFYAAQREDDSETDRIVDEFVHTQKDLLEVLRSFYNSFVSEILAVSRGDADEEARIALGIDERNAKFIFKQNLNEVIRAQERLVSALEPLFLMRTAPLKEKYTVLGRAGVLFRQFLACGKILVEGFRYYYVNYSMKIESMKTLQLKINATLPKKRRESKKRREITLDFIQFWDQLAKTKAVLENKQLSGVLILPVQSITRYKIFFDRILKILGPDYIGRKDGEDASQLAESISKEVDNNIQKANGIKAKLLGNDFDAL